MRESLFTLRVRARAKLAYQCSDEIQAIMKKYYPENSYLVGTTPSTQDIRTTITKDYSRVNVMSLIGVFVVVMWSFKSLIIPLLIMIPIEVAIFVNMAVPYIVGHDDFHWLHYRKLYPAGRDRRLCDSDDEQLSGMPQDDG